MEVLTKVLKLDKDSYFKKHIELTNAALSIGLTPKEIEVAAAFMLLSGDIALDRFGTTARKFVKIKLNLSDGGLGNYLKALKDKRVILLNNDLPYINPVMIPNNSLQMYNIKLIFNGQAEV